MRLHIKASTAVSVVGVLVCAYGAAAVNSHVLSEHSMAAHAFGRVGGIAPAAPDPQEQATVPGPVSTQTIYITRTVSGTDAAAGQSTNDPAAATDPASSASAGTTTDSGSGNNAGGFTSQPGPVVTSAQPAPTVTSDGSSGGPSAAQTSPAASTEPAVQTSSASAASNPSPTAVPSPLSERKVTISVAKPTATKSISSVRTATITSRVEDSEEDDD